MKAFPADAHPTSRLYEEKPLSDLSIIATVPFALKAPALTRPVGGTSRKCSGLRSAGNASPPPTVEFSNQLAGGSTPCFAEIPDSGRKWRRNSRDK